MQPTGDKNIAEKALDTPPTLPALNKAALRERWLADNREAIDAYNRQIEEWGVFSKYSQSPFGI